MRNKKWKLALGTTSKSKKMFLQEVLLELGIDAEIYCFGVSSDISDQPLTQEETREGSNNRAVASLHRKQDADFGIGIEVGYNPNENNYYEMLSSASIIDGQGTIIQAFSSRLLLPEFHQEKLNAGQYLAEHVRNYEIESNDVLTTFTRNMIINRSPFIKESVRNALIGYFSRK